MNVCFVAGFGPIIRDPDSSHSFWAQGMGIPLKEAAPGFWAVDDLEGTKAFGLYPLSQAAEQCFGTSVWPAEIPAPQAWIDLDVESPAAVAEAATELEAAGYRVLRDALGESWGTTAAVALSPEGLLIGVTYTPAMHAPTVS